MRRKRRTENSKNSVRVKTIEMWWWREYNRNEEGEETKKEEEEGKTKK